ncbi:tetratricopeptide repeat protein [Xenorhabdus bovienii]|nr:tetratricopeptide repeat protein [Xenorhabdus bovienii]MDE9430803.1 sel1 repeat family protein [Xenorhabdus bovienii]MDE9488446.1 sel1 repeat family protein [Xenorhabdus bovienii]MDE9504825.1 sel1 repeat family protein [Xenorhabdus bovienii]MDE9546267.1 sel1 repeat family protein [Xenorhabdus bovienii]
MIYLHGRGVEQSIKTAREWFEKAAAQDLPEAQYELGVMYYGGNSGVLRDYQIAWQLFENASRRNHGESQFHLAMMYLLGQGVTKDFKRGRDMFGLACKNGDIEACLWFKELTENDKAIKEFSK